MSRIIAIHLSSALDADLRSEAKEASNAKAAAVDLHQLFNAYGLKPKPLFPGHVVNSLERVWHVACPDGQSKELVQKFLSTAGVEGAYVKPPEGLPELAP